MNTWNDNEWEEFLKSKVEEFEFPFEEKYWQEVQKRLPKNRKLNFKHSVLGIIALLIIFFISYHFYSTNEHQKRTVNNTSLNQILSPNSLKSYHKLNNFLTLIHDKKPIFSNENVNKHTTSLSNFEISPKNTIATNQNSALISLNKKKKSAQLLIQKERISAICRTILIYKALKKQAQNYIPLENAEDFVKKLEFLSTKNLIADNINHELNWKNKELEGSLKKEFFEKEWNFGLGGGFYGSKFSHISDMYFRQYISFFIQYQFHPLFFIQSLPQFSFGKHPNIQYNTKLNPLAFELPLEVGVKWYRQSLSAGIAQDFYFLRSEQKQNFNPYRTNISLSFQSQYHQFMLKINAQYCMNDVSKNASKMHAFRFGVGLFYVFMKNR